LGKNWELLYILTTVNVNLIGLQVVAAAAIVPYASGNFLGCRTAQK
jgi:hypothetical protein